ncbi:MAG: gliding motility-associated C-terminal domain-containing protein [Crocinitomicaceae bacterium]|nr:gliding motility-associated C-terminal domain-containing protein [Crocinitomicaceae bacterium]
MQVIFKLFLFFCFSPTLLCHSQNVLYQDIFKGGVTGDGYNPGYSYLTGNFNVHIESGSTIRSAFLYCNAYNSPAPNKIIFDGTEIILSTNNSLNNYFNINTNNSELNLETIVINVKHLINTNQNTYSFTPPYQYSPNLGGVYAEFYLYITFDNPILPYINTSVFFNKYDATPILNYNLTSFNPLNLTKPIGLSLSAGHFCDTIQDGSNIKINNINFGLLGGAEYNSSEMCSGVSGSFYYQNETLFGLGNDTPTNFMSGSDAIAVINPYLTNNNNFDVTFEYQSNIGPRSNSVYQLFLTYVSTCEPFDVTVSPDTTICQNAPLQFQASGGIRYEWQPATGLSCTDCPNPMVSTDSSMFYTVRIWNNDTCSVVRSVNVVVDSLPDFSSIVISPSICGDSTGTVIAKGKQTSRFSMDGSIPKVSGIFNNLTPGNHTLTVFGENGCGKDSVIFIPETITVNASFIANPPSGGAPLAVIFTNNSTNADGYEWFLNGNSQGANFPSYVFDSVGVYTTTLIAWQNNPACADTLIVHIYVNDTLMIQVPNVFTPNNDGNNDFFGISTNIPVYIDFQIFNRWGNEMVSGKDLKSLPTVSFTPLWNGADAVDGTYFYQLSVRSVEDASLLVKSDGFVVLVK